MSYTLLQGGLAIESTDWEVAGSAAQTLFLERGTATPFTFKVRSVAIQPPLTAAANLIFSLNPIDESVQGSAEYYTDLRMDRFFELTDESVTPPPNHGEQLIPILYSHIPTGQESAASYEVELCLAERLLDVEELEQNASLYEWSFAIRVNDVDFPLNMSAFCGSSSLGADSRITLPTRQPWVTTDPIMLVVDTPNPPNVLDGDGCHRSKRGHRSSARRFCNP